MPRERPALTRDLIVAEALALLDAEGMEGFSMRKLAARLGVEAMSIYHHLPNRQAILGAVVDRVLAGVPVPDRRLGWRARLEQFAEGTYSALMAHPAVVTVMATETADPTDPRALAVADATLGTLGEMGFSAAEQVSIYRAMTSMVFGFVLTRSQGLTRPQGMAGVAWRGDVEAIRAQEEEIPHIVALVPAFLAMTPGEDFRLALRYFLDGLAREHRTDADPSP